ncbi:MAG: hypothetical protein M5U08_21105 [Burkholderiales bacterium]|nr:hypothetical protein [Burkholderiales bacterium]
MPMLTPVPEANDFEPIMFLSIAILAAFADIAPWRPNRMLGRG